MKILLTSWRASDILAGMLSGLLIIVLSTAVSALIFKGPLISYFSIGISCALIGSILINSVIATSSAFPFAIARAEPAPAAIMAIIFANIAEAGLPTSHLAPTLFATLSLASLMVGVTTFFLGFFRLGHVIRFLPYPVLGGIITGTAWLMARASFTLMIKTNAPTTIMAHYFLGIGFALFLLLTPDNKTRPWILSGALLVLTLAINLLLHVNHISHSAAIQLGWLFSSFTPTFIVSSVDASTLQEIDWSLIASQFGYLLSFVAVIIITSLLNVSGLEAMTNEIADLDEELKITGVGNTLSGLVSGMSANLSFTGTLLNKDAGGQSRASGLLASLLCLVVLVGYPDVISYLPKPIIGGLLLFIATKLLRDWLYEGWYKLPHVDYYIVVLILLTIIAWGFLSGIVLGMIITCVVFIIRYAQIDVVKFATTGESHRSNVIRSLPEQQWLAAHGNTIQLFKLQGYLFFGSAKLLVDKVSHVLKIKRALHFLVFDFRLVNGLDSSTSFSFIRLQQMMQHENIQLIFTGCSAELLDQFKQQRVIGPTSTIMLRTDLDQGLEWCEDRVCETMPEALPSETSVSNVLQELISDKDQQAIFLQYLVKMNVPLHQYLFKTGDTVDCLYFIAEGHVSVFLGSDHTALRVSKSGPGTIVGEIGFYLQSTRSATVYTETDCVMYRLTQSAMKEMEAHHPEVASTFHKSIIAVLAARIVHTNYELTLVSQ